MSSPALPLPVFPAPPPPRGSRPASFHYIAGRWFDWCFFIAPAIVSLLVLLAVFRVEQGDTVTAAAGWVWLLPFSVVMLKGHLILVLFRSHLNPTIFRRHRFRFLVMPPLLFVLLHFRWTGIPLAILASVLDLYHSAAQTFGLARIYEARSGNSPLAGRRLDLWLTNLIYTGSALAGLNAVPSFDFMKLWADLGLNRLAAFPNLVGRLAEPIRQGTWAVGGAFLAFYLYSYWKLHRAGHRIVPQKIALLLSFGVGTLYSRLHFPLQVSMFVENMQHSIQYLAIVWWSERRQLSRFIPLNGVRWQQGIVLGALLVVAGGYGYFNWRVMDRADFFEIVTLVSLLHFWYDGFVWSVRKGDV